MNDGKLDEPRDALHKSLTALSHDAFDNGYIRNGHYIVMVRDVACAFLSVGAELVRVLRKVESSLDEIDSSLDSIRVRTPFGR